MDTMRALCSLATLGCEKLLQKSERANFLKSPDDPAGKKDQGHRKRHVDVGVGAAQQGLVDHETMRSLVPPPNRANPRNEAHPIGGENENENGGEEPKRLFGQMPADDSFQKLVQALH